MSSRSNSRALIALIALAGLAACDREERGLNGQPMTVNLANLVTISTGTTNYAHNMAAALLTAIPPLVVYFLVGKLFVQGITAGAIKG